MLPVLHVSLTQEGQNKSTHNKPKDSHCPHLLQRPLHFVHRLPRLYTEEELAKFSMLTHSRPLSMMQSVVRNYNAVIVITSTK